MRALIARDDSQLRRIESAIALIEDWPPSEQRKKACLLAALQSERAEILRYRSWGGNSQKKTPLELDAA
jgi:hypothetical protein